MLRTSLFLFGVYCSLIWSATVSAQDKLPPLSIAAQEMPGLLKEGTDLPYNKVMALLLDGAPMELNVKIYPGQRGVMQWVRQESLCLFGNITLPGQLRIPNSVLSDEEFANLIFAGPFNRVSINLFALHKTPPTDARTIGTQLVGTDMITFTDTNLYAPSFRRLRYAKVASTVEAFRLLEQGRVAMVMAYSVDAALAMKELKIAKDIRFDAGAPVLEFEENLACWRTPATERLVTYVQSRITQSRRDGSLSRLLPAAATMGGKR